VRDAQRPGAIRDMEGETMVAQDHFRDYCLVCRQRIPVGERCTLVVLPLGSKAPAFGVHDECCAEFNAAADRITDLGHIAKHGTEAEYQEAAAGLPQLSRSICGAVQMVLQG